MALEADRGADGLIRQVQKVLGKASQAAAFASLLYGRKGLDGLEQLPPDWLADNAREALAFIATKPKGRHKVRVRRMAAGGNGGLPEGALIEIVNDDMPFLVDSVLGELQARGIGVRLLLHPIFKTRRDKAGRLQDIARRRRRRSGATGTRKATSPSTSRRCRSRRRAISPLRSPPSCERCASSSPTGSRCSSASRRRCGSCKRRRTAPPPTCWPSSTAFLEWLGQDNFTFLGSREFELAAMSESGDLVSIERQRARRAARRERAGAAPRHRAGGHDAGGAPLLLRARPAHHHQGQRGGPRAPARAHGLRRRQDLPPRRQPQRRDPLRRPLHLAGLRAPARPDPDPAPQGRQRACGLRLSARQP